MPHTLLFGSIGTLVETSAIQRRAFNQAFKEAGLDWHWDEEVYRTLLQSSGGATRIARYARAREEEVDVDTLHHRKSVLFQSAIIDEGLTLRPGVTEMIGFAKAANYRLGLVTTTSAENIDALFEGLAPALLRETFDLITTDAMAANPKPGPDIYQTALLQLGTHPADAIAIEDNIEGFTAARAAGLRTIAFPGKYHETTAFPGAMAMTTELNPVLLTAPLAAE